MTYHHPATYRPPLAIGGHVLSLVWATPDHDSAAVATCNRCAAAMPAWALTGTWWMAYADRYCPALIRALPPGNPRPGAYTRWAHLVDRTPTPPPAPLGPHQPALFTT